MLVTVLWQKWKFPKRLQGLLFTVVRKWNVWDEIAGGYYSEVCSQNFNFTTKCLRRLHCALVPDVWLYDEINAVDSNRTETSRQRVISIIIFIPFFFFILKLIGKLFSVEEYSSYACARVFTCLQACLLATPEVRNVCECTWPTGWDRVQTWVRACVRVSLPAYISLWSRICVTADRRGEMRRLGGWVDLQPSRHSAARSRQGCGGREGCERWKLRCYSSLRACVPVPLPCVETTCAPPRMLQTIVHRPAPSLTQESIASDYCTSTVSPT